MRKNHLLVTGATGYLGRAFLACLKSQDFSKITVVLRDGTAAPDLKGVRWMAYSDLMNKNESLADVDIICHLAVPRGANNGSDLAQYLDDLRCLLLKASRYNVSGFIFASSQAVYGSSEPPWSEVTPLAPVTPHGWAKLSGEQLLRAIQETKPPMRCTSLRIPKLVGPGPRFRMDKGEWVHGLAFAALRQQKIRLTSNFLQQKFDFMDVRDAADILRNIAKKDTATWPDVLNIGAGKIVNGVDLITTVNTHSFKLTGKFLNYSVEQKLFKPRMFGMIVDKFNHIMPDFQAKSLDQTVSDVFDFLIGDRSTPRNSKLTENP